jgi:hypothetical protein
MSVVPHNPKARIHGGIYFSRHAAYRALERCRITCAQIAVYLKLNGFVTLGKEPGFNREHRLIYSPDDDAFLVILQDVFTGSVVSIWLADYYPGMVRRITDEEFAQARVQEMQCRAVPHPIEEPRSHEQRLQTIPDAFWLTIRHYDEAGGTRVHSATGAFDNGQQRFTLEQFLVSDDLQKHFLEQLRELEIKPLDALGAVVKLAKKEKTLHMDFVNTKALPPQWRDIALTTSPHALQNNLASPEAKAHA